MKKQVITFGEGKICIWVEKGKDVVISALKRADPNNINGQPSTSDIDLKKSLVLRFNNLEGLNVLQDMLDTVRFTLNIKKSLGGKK